MRNRAEMLREKLRQAGRVPPPQATIPLSPEQQREVMLAAGGEGEEDDPVPEGDDEEAALRAEEMTDLLEEEGRGRQVVRERKGWGLLGPEAWRPCHPRDKTIRERMVANGVPDLYEVWWKAGDGRAVLEWFAVTAKQTGEKCKVRIIAPGQPTPEGVDRSPVLPTPWCELHQTVGCAGASIAWALLTPVQRWERKARGGER